MTSEKTSLSNCNISQDGHSELARIIKFLRELEGEIISVERQINLEKKKNQSKASEKFRDLMCYRAELDLNLEREREKLMEIIIKEFDCSNKSKTLSEKIH
jgi:hypothetical protein